NNATFVIDRFHVARDVQRLFRNHKRYRSIRKKLADYDWEGFMVELNSAVGTLENEKKEERLEELITQLSQYPEALGDYREKLKNAISKRKNEKKEERLEELSTQLSQYPEALGDYREKLKKKGIETDEFRPMGSAEGTMSVFARRLKNGRSWCTEGLDKFIDI